MTERDDGYGKAKTALREIRALVETESPLTAAITRERFDLIDLWLDTSDGLLEDAQRESWDRIQEQHAGVDEALGGAT